MPLLDAKGVPLDIAQYKKSAAIAITPKENGAFGMWAGRDNMFLTLPGGGVMQFDLGRLTLSDYRSMRQHYQLGSSLNVLAFVMHQIDWEIQCDTVEIKDLIEQEIRLNWTPLIRSISQAHWAGYSPIAVNYENREGYTRIKTIKDLVPEECRVEWNKINGWAPPGKLAPTLYEYNGFNQNGFWIPPENTLWYPLLMENGDYYGRKILKAAFPSWFFSNLIHLFSNRYMERFGEPLPIGRGRFGDDVDMGDGVMVNGKKAMENVVQGIRNRAVVVLPSDRDPVTKEYDYSIEYLESQMRGADFERYLSRLDEEMSLAVFTPVLLFRTADVGSYNLGQQHLRIFQQMLNTLAGDLQYYIQNYLVERLRVLNFGPNSKPAFWVYRTQGNDDLEMYRQVMMQLVRTGSAKPDLEELGKIVGLKWTEVKQLVAPPPAPGSQTPPTGAVPAGVSPPTKSRPSAKKAASPPPVKPKPKASPAPKPKVKAGKVVLNEAVARVAREISNGKVPTGLGFYHRFVAALQRDGFAEQNALAFADDFYGKINLILGNVVPVLGTPEEVQSALQKTVDLEIDD